MKKVKTRAVFSLLIALALLLGLGVYIFRFARDGADWASFTANRAVYQNGQLARGTITDRNGVVLARADGDARGYAADADTRMSCLHAVGDFAGNIGAGAIQLFSDELVGYNPVSGVYDPGGEGAVVVLSLDAKLCKAANAALAGRNGAVAVCNYETGEILCMVSSPAYDPESVPSVLPEGAYLNRVTGAAYTPGSVFKIVTLAAAIERIPDLKSRSFWCEGETVVDGQIVHCTASHGAQTVEQAFANSCNCAFAELSLELGGDTLAEYADRLGMTQPLALCGSVTAAGNFEKGDAGSTALAWSGIGQSTDLVCPFAMLRLVSAIAGDGIVQEPTLLLDGETKETRLLDTETAELLADDLRYNVVYGYGEWNFPGLALCGKTGTAEVGDGAPHAWFTGFLQDQEHPYAFVVVIEHGGSGIGAAAPVANAVLQEAVKS